VNLPASKQIAFDTSPVRAGFEAVKATPAFKGEGIRFDPIRFDSMRISRASSLKQ
jgi:hypothetical protein